MDILFHPFHIKIKIRQYIDLVDQHRITDLKHQRIFERFVMPLRYGKDHHIFRCTRIKFCRTDQIAHIFQDRQIHIGHAKTLHALPGHLRIQMAHTPGMQLDRFDTCFRNRLCIHIGINIRFHHTDPEPIL